MYFYIVDIEAKIIPDVDIGFAISATELDASKTFDKMKEIVKYIAETYGQTKILYGLLIFGSSPEITVNFSDYFRTIDSFKSFLDRVQRKSGRPDVDKALALSKEMFTRGAINRLGAKQFLVIIMDGKTVNSQEDLSKAVMPLENDGIKIITVVMPPNADEKQLKQIASKQG